MRIGGHCNLISNRERIGTKYMKELERLGNTNRKEHPDGGLEIQMLENGEMSVTGEEQCRKLQALAARGKLWGLYRNGRHVLAKGVSSGILTWRTFRGEQKLSLKLLDFEILPEPEIWTGWVSPQSIWIP